MPVQSAELDCESRKVPVIRTKTNYRSTTKSPVSNIVVLSNTWCNIVFHLVEQIASMSSSHESSMDTLDVKRICIANSVTLA